MVTGYHQRRVCGRRSFIVQKLQDQEACLLQSSKFSQSNRERMIHKPLWVHDVDRHDALTGGPALCVLATIIRQIQTPS